jgi:hypothetical protein
VVKRTLGGAFCTPHGDLSHDRGTRFWKIESKVPIVVEVMLLPLSRGADGPGLSWPCVIVEARRRVDMIGVASTKEDPISVHLRSVTGRPMDAAHLPSSVCSMCSRPSYLVNDDHDSEGPWSFASLC